MQINKARIFTTFFNSSLQSLNENIIIIPINKIYKQIKSYYQEIRGFQGWWQRTEIKIDSTVVSVLKIPMGFLINDCLKILNYKKIKTVTLIGFCGALNSRLAIGEIVIPTKANFKQFFTQCLVS